MGEEVNLHICKNVSVCCVYMGVFHTIAPNVCMDAIVYREVRESVNALIQHV